jgi:Immunity protein 8
MTFLAAEVKGLFTSEGEPLENCTPSDSECFRLSIRAYVGPWGSEAAESFDFYVCAPKWLEQECEKRGFIVGRHYLITNSFDAAQIRALITKLIHRFQGSNWPEVAQKVARFGYWEFEELRESA